MKSGYRFRRKTTGKPIKVKAGLRNSRKRVMGKQETEEVTENTPEMYGRKKKNIKIKSINEFKKESSYKSTDRRGRIGRKSYEKGHSNKPVKAFRLEDRGKNKAKEFIKDIDNAISNSKRFRKLKEQVEDRKTNKKSPFIIKKSKKVRSKEDEELDQMLLESGIDFDNGMDFSELLSLRDEVEILEREEIDKMKVTDSLRMDHMNLSKIHFDHMKMEDELKTEVLQNRKAEDNLQAKVRLIDKEVKLMQRDVDKKKSEYEELRREGLERETVRRRTEDLERRSTLYFQNLRIGFQNIEAMIPLFFFNRNRGGRASQNNDNSNHGRNNNNNNQEEAESSRGISAEDFKKIKSFRFDPESTDPQHQVFDSCTMCYYPFVVEESVAVLTCNHGFHSRCLESWALRNPTCPTCSADIIIPGAPSDN